MVEITFTAGIARREFNEDGTLREALTTLAREDVPRRLDWAIVPGLAAAIEASCASARARALRAGRSLPLQRSKLGWL